MAPSKVKYKKSEEIIARIVSATERLIEEHGYEGLNIRNICINARVSTGSFYTHFSSKGQLLFSVLANSCMRSIEQPAFNKRTCRQRLENFIQQYAHINTSVGHENLRQVLAFESSLTSQNESLHEIVMEILMYGHKNCEIKKESSIEKLTDIICVCLRGCIYEWCRKNGSGNLEEKMLQCTQLLLSSVWRVDSPC